jgi:vancomycin resistance protein YoaR
VRRLSTPVLGSRLITSLRELPSRPPLIVAGSVAVGVVLLLLGFFVMYQVAYAERIFPGVRALGHDLGGYSRVEARAALLQSIDALSRRQLVVGYAEQSWTLTAQELGLRSDIETVLDAAYAVGHEGSFIERFAAQFGLLQQGRTFEQSGAAFDRDAQSDVLRRVAQLVDRPVQEAQLTVRSDFSVDLQPALTGRKLDIEGSRQRIQNALSSPPTNRLEMVVEETSPTNLENNLDLAREQAARILAAPITLKLDDKVWRLERAQLASILRFNNQLGVEEAAYLDRAALESWARTLTEAVTQSPSNARFSWAAGKLEVIEPSKDGITLDVDATVRAIVTEANGEHRDIPLPVTVEKPAVPMEDRQNLGIKELIESSKTPFAGASDAKRENITLASKRLNGVVVPAGGLFSFNKELGSTSLDAGFKVGWGISTAGSGVKTVPSVAGGICQVATTLFHTVFWSGYPIEERNWHLYWISSYSSKGVVGLDATVDEDAGLDFQFKNPTKNALLIQTWIDNAANLNFALYGTRPDWTVKVEPSAMTDVVKAESDTVVTEEEQTMPLGARLQVERATDGFVVANVRHVIEDGDDRVLRLTSKYRPSRNVILVGTGGKPPTGRPVVESNKPAAQSTVTAAPSAAVQATSKVAPTAAPKTPVQTAPAKPRVAPTPVPQAPVAPKPAVIATPNRPPVVTPTPKRG